MTSDCPHQLDAETCIACRVAAMQAEITERERKKKITLKQVRSLQDECDIIEATRILDLDDQRDFYLKCLMLATIAAFGAGFVLCAFLKGC